MSDRNRNIQTALRVARRMGASPKETKGLLEAGDVESGWRNLNYGDRDSLGVLQQRPSQGWGSRTQVTNVEHAVGEFLKRARQANRKGQSAGELAQAVQRSAFPDRYDQHSRMADAILGGRSGKTAGDRTVVTRTVTPGVDNAAQRKQLLLNYLQQRGRPGALLDLAQGLNGAQDVPGSVQTSTKRYGSTRGRGIPSGRRGVIDLGRLAQKMGLHVGEESRFGGVHPVHAKNSWHYKDRAIDVSGDPSKEIAFARKIDRLYGGKLKELFWNGPGAVNRKNGRRVPKGFVGGHTDHVHVAV